MKKSLAQWVHPGKETRDFDGTLGESEITDEKMLEGIIRARDEQASEEEGTLEVFIPSIQ